MQKIFFQPEVVPAPFFGSPPKAYYAHPALLGTLCQSLGSIGRVVSEKNGNRQTNIHFENRRPYRDRLHLRFKPNDRNRRSNISPRFPSQ